MKIQTKQTETMTILLNNNETEVLMMANSILKKIQDRLNDNEQMVAIETGEAITEHDLGRARGILSGIADHIAWEKI